jgi:hypothetical protein
MLSFSYKESRPSDPDWSHRSLRGSRAYLSGMLVCILWRSQGEPKHTTTIARGPGLSRGPGYQNDGGLSPNSTTLPTRGSTRVATNVLSHGPEASPRTCQMLHRPRAGKVWLVHSLVQSLHSTIHRTPQDVSNLLNIFLVYLGVFWYLSPKPANSRVLACTLPTVLATACQ